MVVGEPAILAEGEFDALLVWQEAGDLVGVATLGSCNRVSVPKRCATCWAARGCWWPTTSMLRERRAPSGWGNCRRACTGFGRRRART